MLHWGIVSTGGIAHRAAKALQSKDTAGLACAHAVYSRSMEKARQFAGEFGIAQAYDSLDAMLADPQVEAVYVANPHPFHCETVLKAAAAGKHILCEKTLAMNLSQAEKMVKAAKSNRILLTEAFTYRVCKRTRKLRELLQTKAVGKLQHLTCNFFFQSEKAPARLTEKELGGGAMLDLGCYAMSMARMVAGISEGKVYSEPQVLAGHAQFAANGIDDYACALLRFSNGMGASLACGIHAQRTLGLSIIGSEGRIEIDEPWFEQGVLRLIRGKNQHAEIFDYSAAAPDRFADLFAHISRCVQEGRTELPEMTPEDSLGNVAALDAWRRKIGLFYAEDSY